MKKFLSFVTAFVLAISSFAVTNVFANYDNEISLEKAENIIVTVPVYIDGVKLKSDVPGQIIEDLTLVPFRAIFEALGAEVLWDDETKTASATKDETVIKISIGDYRLLKNETEVALDVPARIIDSRTLVPICAIAESFDCTVDWLDDIRTVRIISGVLPDAVITEADKKIVYHFNETAVSQATYDFYTALLQQSLNSAPTEEQVLELLKEIHAARVFADMQGITPDILDRDYINGVILKAIKGGEYDLYIKSLNATDTALRKLFEDSYYLTALQEYVYNFTDKELVEAARKDFIRVKHILVRTKEEADLILAKLSEGQSFEALASEYSLDGMDTETGYVFTKGEMIEPFEKASFELADGEISSPVESAYGFHIIKKYPMSELSDEFLLLNYGVKILNYENYVKVNTTMWEILTGIVVTKA